jgi:alpha-N-arabinofuranosidase
MRLATGSQPVNGLYVVSIKSFSAHRNQPINPFDNPIPMISAENIRSSFSKRSFVVLQISLVLLLTAERAFASPVNGPVDYTPVSPSKDLVCKVFAQRVLGTIDPRIYGTNLEWFNEAGGLASSNKALVQHIENLAREQGVTVYRFPGGILADYYHWPDGIGPIMRRPIRKHPTDQDRSANLFGTPEFLKFLQRVRGEPLITVNAGTGNAKEAAEWVAYINSPNHPDRIRDGISNSIRANLWEVGNELYLPGNPTEEKITVSPEVYAARFNEFAAAMKAVDPKIELMAIAVAKSHIGPWTEFPDWTEKVLGLSAKNMDYVAVHNAYFPMLYRVKQPRVEDVYPALWAAPEAVGRSLDALEGLLEKYEGNDKKINIAITEWGPLYSLPRADVHWFDHVKTLGSGIFVARTLQVFMEHPRVKVANYFKLADRSFMGWVGYDGVPKVPYWVFQLYARHFGDQRVAVNLDSPVYNSVQVGATAAEANVKEVTAVAALDRARDRLYVNFVNRSLRHNYRVKLQVEGFQVTSPAVTLWKVAAREPTAHNGRDIPPDWPYDTKIEPFTTLLPNSIRLISETKNSGDFVDIPPFSIITVELVGHGQ